VKKKFYRIAIICANVVLLLLMCSLILISPYNYEWDESLKQVGDNIDVLRIAWGSLIIVILVLAIFTKIETKRCFVWYAASMCFSVYNLVTLILIK
jgi:hypothetical protein